jgi:hypothetical protein
LRLSILGCYRRPTGAVSMPAKEMKFGGPFAW